MFRLSALLPAKSVRRIKANMQSVKIVLYKGGNDVKLIIKGLFCILGISGILFFLSRLAPVPVTTSSTSETVTTSVIITTSTTISITTSIITSGVTTYEIEV